MVDLIFNLFLILMLLFLVALLIRDVRDSRKLDKQLKDSYNKIMEDTTSLIEISKLRTAINEANLNIYITPKGKYILIPKENK